MTKTLIDLVRHGEPEGGPMFRGQTDHPLSDTGWQQMRDALQEADCWDVVVTSPLLRCSAFAEEVANRLQVPLHSDANLKELGFGAWEGHTTEQVMASWGQELQRFWEDPVTHTPPGGEPLADFNQRVLSAWHHWRTELAGQRVLMVCHGGVIRAVLAATLEAPLSASFRTVAVPYACRSRIRMDDSPHGVLTSLVSHGSLEG